MTSTSHASRRADLLDPYELSRLSGLELATPEIVEGFIAGLHRSPRRGFSVEFAEHRMYQSGDELRYIDWKLLGRTDRLYVKQFEEETNLRAMVVLDTSGSMNWTGSPERRLTKLDYARRLAAALVLILLRQRDATGLITFDEAVRSITPPRARLNHWRDILKVLTKLKPGKGTAAEGALTQVISQLRRRGLVIFVSDLLMDRDLAMLALKFLRHRGHQVLVLHVMDPDECELRGPAEARFEDPESERAITLKPEQWAAVYRRTVAGELQLWEAACRRNRIGYERIMSDQPFGPALKQALVRATHVA